jgi:hypothetical protein
MKFLNFCIFGTNLACLDPDPLTLLNPVPGCYDSYEKIFYIKSNNKFVNFYFFDTSLACLEPEPLTLLNPDQKHHKNREINDELQKVISYRYLLDCFACEIRELHKTPIVFCDTDWRTYIRIKSGQKYKFVPSAIHGL